MEVILPLEQSILDWDNDYDDKTVENYVPSANCLQENGDNYINDQTFHTPSFGDEEFDIPPINLPPTSMCDQNSPDVYGSTQNDVNFLFQPLSHHQQTDLSNSQQHMLPPSPPLSQHSPQAHPPCSQQSIGQQQPDRGLIMTSVASSTALSPYAVQHGQFTGPQVTNPHVHQQQDMYMVQLGNGAMMPPQAVQFQVQPYNIPTSYSNGGPMDHPQRMDHPQYRFSQERLSAPQMHHLQQHHPHMVGPSSMLALHLGPPRQQRPGSVGSSPPGSNHTSPGLETSEDSDDSGQHLTQLMGGIKRPSPEPIERPSSGGKPLKKPKTAKKKKKRDPNEPQKPVSAYALFFRDTQAAIKGQNPNASFGEVSKIVASMWDGLDVDHKNVYKRKTEAAKKEYLKALAAYRASLVSKAANEQTDSIYGNGNPGPAVTSSSPMGNNGGGPSPLQKKSPLLTSLMENTSPMTSLHNMTQPQPLLIGQSSMGSMPPPHMLPQHMQHGHPSHPMLHQMLSPGGQHRVHLGAPQMMGPQHPMNGHCGPPNQQRNGQMNNPNNNNNTMAYQPTMMASPDQLQHGGGPGSQQGVMCSPPPQLQNCVRNGGGEPMSQEWDRDYGSNDCVVSHCRDVYTTWVTSRPPAPNSYASVK